MVAHQLDLFGGPLKPPKKIKVDDYEIPADEPKPVAEPVDILIEEPVLVENNVVEIPIEAAPDNDIIPTNDIEWAPEANDEGYTNELTSEDETGEMNAAAIHEADTSAAEVPSSNDEPIEAAYTNPAEQETEQPAFTDEAIFTPPVTAADVATQVLAAPVLADEIPADDPSQDDTQSVSEGEVLKEAPDEEIETAIITESFAEAAPGRRGKNDQDEDNDGLNVPPDEELFKRQYYSMRETSAMFGVNQSLLRFWENEFDILQPKKNKKGDRYFRPVDIKNLVLIYHLLRVRKFTMDGAKDYLQSHKKAGDTFELIKRLEKLKSFLFELKAGL